MPGLTLVVERPAHVGSPARLSVPDGVFGPQPALTLAAPEQTLEEGAPLADNRAHGRAPGRQRGRDQAPILLGHVGLMVSLGHGPFGLRPGLDPAGGAVRARDDPDLLVDVVARVARIGEHTVEARPRRGTPGEHATVPAREAEVVRLHVLDHGADGAEGERQLEDLTDDLPDLRVVVLDPLPLYPLDVADGRPADGVALPGLGDPRGPELPDAVG